MNYFETQEYRRLIEIAFKLKSKPQKKTFAAAAVHCRVQPTYFSNVIKGRADFNDDQIYSLSEYLGLSEMEENYLKACHQWARSGLKERRQFLQDKITSLREQALSPAHRFKAAKVEKLSSEEEMLFFLDPIHQVVMLALGIDRDAKVLEKIKSELSLSQSRLDSILENLVKLDRIKFEKNRYVKTSHNYHLGADSKILSLHQERLRSLSVERMRQLSRKDFKAFSVSLGASRKDRGAVEEILTEALERIRKVTTESTFEPDTVYQMNLDFFPWFSP